MENFGIAIADILLRNVCTIVGWLIISCVVGHVCFNICSVQRFQSVFSSLRQLLHFIRYLCDRFSFVNWGDEGLNRIIVMDVFSTWASLCPPGNVWPELNYSKLRVTRTGITQIIA